MIRHQRWWTRSISLRIRYTGSMKQLMDWVPMKSEGMKEWWTSQEIVNVRQVNLIQDEGVKHTPTKLEFIYCWDDVSENFGRRLLFNLAYEEYRLTKLRFQHYSTSCIRVRYVRVPAVTIQLSGKMSSGEVVAALLSAMIVIHLHYIAAAGCWDFVAQINRVG